MKILLFVTLVLLFSFAENLTLQKESPNYVRYLNLDNNSGKTLKIQVKFQFGSVHSYTLEPRSHIQIQNTQFAVNGVQYTDHILSFAVKQGENIYPVEITNPQGVESRTYQIGKDMNIKRIK